MRGKAEAAVPTKGLNAPGLTSSSIVDGVTCGQHENGNRLPVLTKLFANAPAVTLGQHDVQQDQIESADEGLFKPLLAVVGHFDPEVFTFQGPCNLARDDLIVFHK